MAASTGINDGGIAKLLVRSLARAGNQQPIGHLINCSISYSHDPREITTKSSSLGAKDYSSGLTGWTMSGEAYFAENLTGSENYSTMFGFLKNRTLIYVWYGSYGTNAGDKVYTGQAYITSINRTAGNQGESETWTLELQGTGALTETTLST